MKKLFAILLALAMILAMSVTAFAEEEKFTLTITGAAGHTYDIYQIFTGDVSQEGDKSVLSNVKYGLNHYPADGQTGENFKISVSNNAIFFYHMSFEIIYISFTSIN